MKYAIGLFLLVNWVIVGEITSKYGPTAYWGFVVITGALSLTAIIGWLIDANRRLTSTHQNQ